MAITLDGTVGSLHQGGSSNMTQSITVANNSNRVLVVTFATHQSGGDATAMTYNSVALTRTAEQIGSFGESVSIWTLVAPATGANTLSVTCPNNDYNAITWYSLYNASQSTTYATSTGTGNSSNLTVTSFTPNSANNWIIDVVESEAVPSMTTGSGRTQDVVAQGSQTFENSGSSHTIQTTATAVTEPWTSSFGARWNMAAVAIEPAAATDLTLSTSDSSTATENTTMEVYTPIVIPTVGGAGEKWGIRIWTP